MEANNISSEMVLSNDFKKITYLNLISDEIKEKINHLKRLNMQEALETALRGAVSFVLNQFNMKFLYAPNESSYYRYDLIFDLNRDYENPQELRWHPHYGPKVNASIIDFEGRMINRFSAMKYKLEEYSGHIPLSAIKHLPNKISEKAFILDIIKNPDPMLVYPIYRKTFIEKTMIRKKLFREDIVETLYIPIITPFYAVLSEWE